jgi:membrane protein CcdC involved in cytochrome C biogenesis
MQTKHKEIMKNAKDFSCANRSMSGLFFLLRFAVVFDWRFGRARESASEEQAKNLIKFCFPRSDPAHCGQLRAEL